MTGSRVLGAYEPGGLGAQFLAPEILSDCSKGFIASQFIAGGPRDTEWARGGHCSGSMVVVVYN